MCIPVHPDGCEDEIRHTCCIACTGLAMRVLRWQGCRMAMDGWPYVCCWLSACRLTSDAMSSSFSTSHTTPAIPLVRLATSHIARPLTAPLTPIRTHIPATRTQIPSGRTRGRRNSSQVRTPGLGGLHAYQLHSSCQRHSCLADQFVQPVPESLLVVQHSPNIGRLFLLLLGLLARLQRRRDDRWRRDE